MRNVKIIRTGTNREYDLTPAQVRQFSRELRRTAPWRTCTGLVAYLLGNDRYTLPLTASDATIKITRYSGRVKEYTLHGRTVLRDPSTQRKRQFYMGAVMLEWVS